MRELVLGLGDMCISISEALDKTVQLYLKTGHKRFRQEVVSSLKLKKQEAHRRKILQKNELSEGKPQAKKRKTKITNTEANQDSDTNICSGCGSLFVNSRDEWIQCDQCDKWYE